MKPSEIKKKVLEYEWEWWLERPFGAFILSLFPPGHARESFRKLGVNAQYPASFYQRGAWYTSDKVHDLFERELKQYLASGGSVFKIVKSCEQFRIDSIREILRLNRSKQAPLEKLSALFEIFATNITYVWLTHGFEHLYKKILLREVPKYIPKAQIDKFIGDMSFPKKKNAHHFMEAALRGNVPLQKIRKKYGWIKVRDGFSRGFSLNELRKERLHLRGSKIERFRRPGIAKQLQKLAKISQELVYFRTLRTDILFELLWVSRPILREIGRMYHIPFKSLQNYTIQELLAGKPRKHPYPTTLVTYGEYYAFYDKPVLSDKYGPQNKLRGIIANAGNVRGQAKIVKTAYEIGKVKHGDILIAPTTAPSFIIGMKKAAAFVTDEGGVTSHAAIVSREMGKPCIIGTKIATKIFKDGDNIEVDAYNGVVRKLTE